jgi:hypothetical protein
MACLHRILTDSDQLVVRAAQQLNTCVPLLVSRVCGHRKRLAAGQKMSLARQPVTNTAGMASVTTIPKEVSMLREH